MNLSIYTAATGAHAQQTKMDVIANNMANLQTEGYKTQNAGFIDLLYARYKPGATKDPNVGSGAAVEKTDFLFDEGGVILTEGKYDYSINGEGFFAVYDMGMDEVFYTRNGQFHLSDFGDGIFYLVDQNGNMVVDPDMGLIPITPGKDENLNVGIFDFAHKESILAKGQNYFQPSEKSGDPIVQGGEKLRRGVLEDSNVDMANEMARVIESQRAYSMVMKMIQTTDEVEQLVNSLR